METRTKANTLQIYFIGAIKMVQTKSEHIAEFIALLLELKIVKNVESCRNEEP